MIARTQTISSKVKPRWPASFILGARLGTEHDVRSGAGSALLAVRTVGQDVVGAALARSAIQIGAVPGVIGHGAALQVRAIPRRQSRRPARQRAQSLRG